MLSVHIISIGVSVYLRKQKSKSNKSNINLKCGIENLHHHKYHTASYIQASLDYCSTYCYYFYEVNFELYLFYSDAGLFFSTFVDSELAYPETSTLRVLKLSNICSSPETIPGIY